MIISARIKASEGAFSLEFAHAPGNPPLPHPHKPVAPNFQSITSLPMKKERASYPRKNEREQRSRHALVDRHAGKHG